MLLKIPLSLNQCTAYTVLQKEKNNIPKGNLFVYEKKIEPFSLSFLSCQYNPKAIIVVAIISNDV